MNGEGRGLSPRLENDMQTVPTCALRGLGHRCPQLLTAENMMGVFNKAVLLLKVVF